MQKLSVAGQTIAGFFRLLLRLLSHASEAFIQQLPRRKLILEEQRFRLWATNLGLFQHGHSSLDYRLRDADLVKNYVLDVLDELIEYLSELTDIISGKRLPYESQPPEDIGVDPVEDESLEIDEDAQPLGDGDDDTCSELELGNASINSESPLQEVSVRFNGVVERIDSLYSLATKIRNPTTRPIRPTAELYKHYTAGNYLEYMQERISIETHIVRYIHTQQILESKTSTLDDVPVTRVLDSSDSDSSDGDFVTRFLQEADWLICRMGKANARRRQQFVYWREHADLISRPEPEPQMGEQLPMRQLLEPDTPASVVNTGSDANLPTASQLHSGPTTSTRLDPQHVKLDDTKSVITHSSRMSTAVGPKGEAVLWPDPPSYVTTDKFFVCQYCMTICPERYLGGDQWKIHLIHDLQPYQCTYKDCVEPDRIYGSRQEWLNHESLSHTRVWCCSTHTGEEFETQVDYLCHLEEEHQNEANQLRSPEVVAACMRSSSIPHRSCPLCPTNFTTATEMQSHIAYHLERFALLAMPKLSDLGDSASDSGGSIWTGEAAARAPKSVGEDSRKGDFDRSKPLDLGDTMEANVYDGDIVKLTSTLLMDDAKLWTIDERNLSTRYSTQTWVSGLAPSEDMIPVDTVPTNQPPWMFLPRRLLLVLGDDSGGFVGYLRLLLRKEIEERWVELQGNDRRYAILGPGLVDLKYYTDNDNYFERRSEISSDGVLLRAANCARSLGIQFLWVPEICIIHKNENDERREASLESDVYDRATHIWLTEEDIRLVEKESDPLLAAERRAYETHSMGDKAIFEAERKKVKWTKPKERVNDIRYLIGIR